MPNINFINNSNLPLQSIKDTKKFSLLKKHQEPKKVNQQLSQNVSQSQEQKMEIDDLVHQGMKGSLSTQDSSNIHLSNDLKINLKNLNCANSHIIPNNHENIFLFEEPKVQESKEIPMEIEQIQKPLDLIPVPNPIMKKLAKDREEMMKKSEKEIFKFKFSSQEEYISFLGGYANDIYSNLLQDEKNLKIKPIFGYMDHQDDINFHMRAVLIDWIVEVHDKYHFKDETLYQTVWIIDTYSSLKPVQRTKFQLLGVTALLIACKSHEIYYPQIPELIQLVDNAYAKQEIIEMENTILKELKFDIIAPSACDFYNIISKAYNFDRKQYFLGKYFMESSLLDYNLLKYSPSVIGIACAYFVMKFFGFNNYKELYSKKLMNEEANQKTIKDAAREICFLVRNLHDPQTNIKAVKEKYSSPEYLNVAFYGEEEQ